MSERNSMYPEKTWQIPIIVSEVAQRLSSAKKVAISTIFFLSTIALPSVHFASHWFDPLMMRF
jgi:hypothetical protein